MQTEPDVEIIKRAKKGDLKAFNEIIELQKSSVFHFCLKLLSIREEAEEVSQDVFVIVYKKLRSFKGKSKFTTWLYRITYNECVSRMRKNKRHEKVREIYETELQLSFIEKSYDVFDNKYKERLIDRTLDELDEESRTIILMYYYHEKSVAEISEVTRLSVTNVKTKLFRARKTMLWFMEKKLNVSKSELLEK